MNAHQRRIERRKPRWVFDLETYPLTAYAEPTRVIIDTGRANVGGFVPPDMNFSFLSLRPQGERLSTTIPKERNPGPFFLTMEYDLTKLEARIEEMIACGGGRSPGKGVDSHRLRASEMFNVPYEDVTDEQRAAGKNANYIDWWKV